jgi:hypothetical protein
VTLAVPEGAKMPCSGCGQGDGLEEEGRPITFIFGTEIAGYLCRACAMERETLWESALRDATPLTPELLSDKRMKPRADSDA